MKATPHIDYKALYEQSLKYSGDQEKMIALLQGSVTQCVKDRQRLARIVIELKEDIDKKEQLIAEQAGIITLQQKTLKGQSVQIEQQQTIITDQNKLISAQRDELTQNKKELATLVLVKHELKVLKKMIYGRRSEKHYSTDSTAAESKTGLQLSFNMEVDAVATCSIKDAKLIAAYIRVRKQVTERQPHPGRYGWPEGLRQEIITIDAPDRPEGSRLLRVVEQKQLACTNTEFFLKITRRLVYMAPAEQEGTFKQLIAPLPPHPIAKCKADISVLILLVIDKFIYHLPAWRQQQRFKQYGIELKYNTMLNWINRVCDVLEPLYNLLLRELIISSYLMMDETTYRVLDNEKVKGKKSHIGYLWGCNNPIQKIVAFCYQKGRGKKDVQHILQGYKGYLQTDGYGAYTKYGRQPGVTHLQCLTHARRYFVEAMSNDRKRCEYVLEHFFTPLYKIEQQCRDAAFSYDQIGEKRQQEAIPVLDSFYNWLQEELPQVISRTPIHKAILYTLTRFKELRAYTTDGMLQIDNNLMEQQIRPIVVGRRNYLFAGSHRGGQRAAIIYSLMGSCKLQGIDPSVWLDDVLHRITIHPKENLATLLPQFWKPLQKKTDTASQTLTA